MRISWPYGGITFCAIAPVQRNVSIIKKGVRGVNSKTDNGKNGPDGVSLSWGKSSPTQGKESEQEFPH